MEPLLTEDGGGGSQRVRQHEYGGCRARLAQWLGGGQPAAPAADASAGPPRRGGGASARASSGSREGDFPAAGGEMIRLGAFVGLLFTGWMLQKGLCQLGIPKDCDGSCIPGSSGGGGSGRPHNTRCGEPFANGWLGHLEGLQRLLSYGSVAGLLLGAHRPQRHRYLFTGQLLPSPPSKCRLPGWWPLVYLATIPTFSLVMGMSAFQGSLHRGSSYPTGLLTLDSIAGVCAIVLTVWHVWYGLRWSGGWRGFLFGFILPRLAVIVWHGAYYAILVPQYATGDSDGDWHVPHWIAAWLLAVGCRWNHVLSALPMALCLAVFTQGLVRPRAISFPFRFHAAPLSLSLSLCLRSPSPFFVALSRRAVSLSSLVCSDAGHPLPSAARACGRLHTMSTR
jgi:hypothetical protein